MKTSVLFYILLFLSLLGYSQELTETKSTFQNYDQIRDLEFISDSELLVSATAFNNGLLRTIITRFVDGIPANNAFAITSNGNNNLGYTSNTSSGDILLAGRAVLNTDVGSAPTVLKISPDGTVIWTSSFEGEGVAGARDVFEMENGQLSGINFNAPFFQSTLFMMDADGTLIEQKELFIDGEAALFMNHNFTGNQTSLYGGVFPDPDSNQLLPFVVKTVNGAIDWCKTYDAGIVLSETQFPDFLMDVAEDGSIFLGTTHSSIPNANGNEVVLTKLDAEGEVLWSRISDSTPTAALGLFLETVISGEVWFGFSYLTDMADMVLTRWDAAGDASVFVTSNAPSRLLTKMAEKADQTMVMAGVNLLEEDSYVVEVSADGDFPCGAETQDAYFSENSIVVEDRTAEFVDVNTLTIAGAMSTLVVGTETVEECSIVLSAEEENKASFEVYPNPVIDVITIIFKSYGDHAVTVTDATGKVVSESLHSSDRARIDMSKFVKGLYLIQTNGQTKRVIKE